MITLLKPIDLRDELDKLVITHYNLWVAFTTEEDTRIARRGKELVHYLQARGLL